MASEFFKSISWLRSKQSKNDCNFPTDIRELRDPQTRTRRDARIATYRVVDICSECGEILTGATIRDLSKNGALIQLKSREQLPARLVVRSPVEPSVNGATLKWALAQSAGVEFDNEVSVPDGPPDINERIRVISSHIAAISATTASGKAGSIGSNKPGGQLPEHCILELLHSYLDETAGRP